MKSFLAITIAILLIIFVHTMLSKDVVAFLGNFCIGWCIASLIWKLLDKMTEKRP